MIRAAALIAAAFLLSGCGGSPARQPDGFAFQGSTDSPIAGTTLRCSADYPDSRLVFSGDGTLGGRYAGHDVTGSWQALSPDTVEMMMRAGGIAVHDVVRQTGGGWRGQNTSCG